MNRGVLSAAALAVFLCGVPAAVPACAQDEGSSPLADQAVPGAPALPGLPPAPFPDFGRSWPFFPPGQNTIKPRPRGQLPGGLAPGARRPNLEQGDAAAARAEALKKALVPKPSPEAVRKEMLDKLFERLRSAAEPEEAQRIAQSIQRLWLRSASDTANLLMERAMASAQAQQLPLAIKLFDKLVAIEPEWAEAWNQRAMAKFLSGDRDAAMADINGALKLEPRHFGALQGMGVILEQAGLTQRALEVFKKALEIYPLAPDLQKKVEKLMLDTEGQDI